LFLATEIILENNRPLGECWDAWQEEDFRGAIEHQNSMLLRPRGHSKTGDVGALITHALVTGPRGTRIYSAASDQAQANLLLDDVIGKFRRNPRLRKLIKTTSTSVTVPATGSKFTTLAADAPGSYGLRIDYLIADELAEWPPRSEALWV